MRAGIVDRLNDYPWSSHKGCISKAKKWEWLAENYILDIFFKDKSPEVTANKRFISTEEPAEIIRHHSRKHMRSILGSEKFLKRVKERFPKKKKGKQIPGSKKLCPEAIDIKRAVCNHYKTKQAD